MSEEVLEKIEHEEWRVEKYLADEGERFRVTLLAQEEGDQEVGISELNVHEVASLFRSIRAMAVLDDDGELARLIRPGKA